MSKSAQYYEVHADLAKSQKRAAPFKRPRYSALRQERRSGPSTRSMPADYVPIEQTRVTPRELGIEEPETEATPEEPPFYLRD